MSGSNEPAGGGIGDEGDGRGPDPMPHWVDEVIEYWFSEIGEPGWWSKGEAIDRQIHERFRSVHDVLVSGKGKLSGGREVLAAVIVLDQFSRHLFRGSPGAYDSDPIARGLARLAIEQGLDLVLLPEERLFLYMPFEHSEVLSDQAYAVELIERLGNEEWTRSAIAHKALIMRFGRFPHRNAILGRNSTAEELQALEDPGNSY
jgi:uncharacterized protein (DUF924 family)